MEFFSFQGDRYYSPKQIYFILHYVYWDWALSANISDIKYSGCNVHHGTFSVCFRKGGGASFKGFGYPVRHKTQTQMFRGLG